MTQLSFVELGDTVDIFLGSGFLGSGKWMQLASWWGVFGGCLYSLASWRLSSLQATFQRAHWNSHSLSECCPASGVFIWLCFQNRREATLSTWSTSFLLSQKQLNYMQFQYNFSHSAKIRCSSLFTSEALFSWSLCSLSSLLPVLYWQGWGWSMPKSKSSQLGWLLVRVSGGVALAGLLCWVWSLEIDCKVWGVF